VFEEYARWIAPIGMSPRRVAKHWSFGDVDFEPEDRVFFMFGSPIATRPALTIRPFRHHPRYPKKGIAFERGPHYCAGAFASRAMVADVALPGIFARLKGLRLDDAEPVRTAGDRGDIASGTAPCAGNFSAAACSAPRPSCRPREKR